MAFTGWPESAQRFIIGLQLDNSRSYFEANRELYARDVKAPMEALSAELEKVVGPGHVFRINRDIRFSKDKSPYKTSIAAWWASQGGELYVHLDAKDFYVWSGKHEMDNAMVERFRRGVADDATGERLVSIVSELERKGYKVEGGEALKRVPPGYPKDHPRERFLRHKNIGVSRSFGLQPWLGTPEPLDRVLEVWRDAAPLRSWLQDAVFTPAAG
jgi:uncharacterized protein (TIGR02453 family)